MYSIARDGRAITPLQTSINAGEKKKDKSSQPLRDSKKHFLDAGQRDFIKNKTKIV